MDIEIFQPGDQIIYIPAHADNDPDHPDCEFGFVTTVGSNNVFCRYWDKSNKRLRTTANSEATSPRDLYLWDSHPQNKIDILLKAL